MLFISLYRYAYWWGEDGWEDQEEVKGDGLDSGYENSSS